MLQKEQLEYVYNLYQTHENFRKCAEIMGTSSQSFQYKYKKAKHFFEYNVDEPEVLKGTSTLYRNNPDGTKEQVLTWVKTNVDFEQQKELLMAIFEGLKSEIKPLSKIKEPELFEKDLMAEYILTDLHLGMLAEKSEVGADWNIDIAKTAVERWLSHSVNSAPNCEQAVFAQMGDFQHFSSMFPVTPLHGNLLDASARPNKIIKAATELMCQVIDTLLTKHKKVHVIIADANHDDYGQAALRTFLPLLYKNEPRITIDTGESPFYCYEFGNVSCYYHHGHKKNIKDVSKVFASYFREVYGRTKYSYGRLGHLHHTARNEDSLMQVEIFPTLAPADAYAHGKGYKANRGAVTIIHHKEYGEVQRITTSPNIIL